MWQGGLHTRPTRCCVDQPISIQSHLESKREDHSLHGSQDRFDDDKVCAETVSVVHVGVEVLLHGKEGR